MVRTKYFSALFAASALLVAGTPALGQVSDPPTMTGHEPQPTDQPTGVDPANTLYIRPSPITATSLEGLIPARSGSVEVVGQFAHNGDTITFGTMVHPGEDVSDTLNASFTELWNSLTFEGTDPPNNNSLPMSPSDDPLEQDASPLAGPALPPIPRYSVVTLDVPADYTNLAAKSGVQATPAPMTDAEDDAAYDAAVSAAQNAVVPGTLDPETGEVITKTGQCYKQWWPSYSSIRAGNHRRAISGSLFEHYGQVRTEFKWTGSRMNNLLACHKTSGWEQDFFMDPAGGYWLKSKIRTWSSNVPTIYRDTGFRDSGRGFGFGVVRASKLKVDKKYYIEFTALRDNQSSDKAGITNDQTVGTPTSCVSKWCMFVKKKADIKRGFTVPQY